MMPWCEDFDLIRYETLFSVQSRWALGVGYFSLDGKVRVMYTEPLRHTDFWARGGAPP